MKLIINNDEYELKSFMFRIANDDNNSGIYQKAINCDLKEIATVSDIEDLFTSLKTEFEGSLTIETKDSSFEFEGYNLLDINLFGEGEAQRVTSSITFMKPIDEN